METNLVIENNKKGISVIGLIALVILIIGELMAILINVSLFPRLVAQFGYSGWMSALNASVTVIFSVIAAVLAVIGFLRKKSNNALNIAALSIAIWNIATSAIYMCIHVVNMLRNLVGMFPY